ncbi:MAG: ABC transporter ATP-binding protein [Candidatus Sumerlaeia bacterium]|nr:ABC transporter ATP-binding protein [Candidatus Sumerlaeia bacterium]
MEIRVGNLEFQYGSGSGFRLLIPEFQLSEGSQTAILGPSGSGKSTLLNLIAGILVPNAGTIHAGDRAIHELPATDRRRFRLRNVGYLFQDFALLDYLDARENVLLPYRLYGEGHPTREDRQRAVELMESVGIGHLQRRPVTRLSRGEQQRVALCRSLVTEPGLLLADEPTGNLDPVAKQDAIMLLREGARKRGATLLVVTHDHNLVHDFDKVHDMDEMSAGAGR